MYAIAGTIPSVRPPNVTKLNKRLLCIANSGERFKPNAANIHPKMDPINVSKKSQPQKISQGGSVVKNDENQKRSNTE